MKTYYEILSNNIFRTFGIISLIIPLYLSIRGSLKSNFINHTAATLSCAAILIIFGGLPFAKKGWPLIFALLISVAGDYFLSHKSSIKFSYVKGIACFFIAHVLYITFFMLVGNKGIFKYVFLVFALTGGLIYFFIRLQPHIIGIPMKIAVLSYLVVSIISLSFVMNLRIHPLALTLLILGIALLVFSDTMIAEKDFMRYPGRLPIIPTYLASHFFLTSGGLIMHYLK